MSDAISGTYTTEQASEEALKWCQKNPGWKRICDIPDHNSLYRTFEEMPKRVQDKWESAYPGCAEEAWEEFGVMICKVKFGFVSGAGIFYNSVLRVPRFHQHMMVFKTD